MQEDLRHLKEQLSKTSNLNQVDLHMLDDALTKTEEGIKVGCNFIKYNLQVVHSILFAILKSKL